jgi:hypothetical protein
VKEKYAKTFLSRTAMVITPTMAPDMPFIRNTKQAPCLLVSTFISRFKIFDPPEPAAGTIIALRLLILMLSSG